MKIFTIGLFLTCLPAAASSIFLGEFAVSPQGTFLRQSSMDTCSWFNTPGCNMNPTFIDLAVLGVNSADRIRIVPFGELCVYTAPCVSYPALLGYLGGVLDSTNVLLGPSNLNRLPGAIQTSLSNVTDSLLNTSVGGLPTTIAQDFYILNTTSVVIPAGTRYLVVGVLDSGYSDNSSSSLGVRLYLESTTAPTVPEPTTALMFLGGGIGLFCIKRKIR